MTFIDTTGRSIEIEGDYNIQAFHNGQRIGCIEFDDKDGHAVLWGMNVDRAYQRSGIATQMMRLAAELHGKRFGKPSFNAVGGSHASSDRYYTQEGAALIRRCLREDILEDTELHD
ncbi:GNAT family N-acetyltransferase [Chromobacterium vaccinii]|uniref:GNAT family N-acetyltransferase n=1 Tax=Chromobacterium vaccinii TaxID=1108595 RepID=UPI001E633844|nr:GNAT family N-acetyltransferase [Chromobacterium vaccinii]MCD4502144.1 GNAT family N-acetyltransferase [Chromobacterium vaccinii]